MPCQLIPSVWALFDDDVLLHLVQPLDGAHREPKSGKDGSWLLASGDGVAFCWHRLRIRGEEIDGELRHDMFVTNARKEHTMIQYWFPVIFLGGMLVIAAIVTRMSDT
jgi:hypothetical protein